MATKKNELNEKLKAMLTDAGKGFEVGFNHKFQALEDRDDLAEFLINAYRAKRDMYIGFFGDNAPSLEELEAAKADAELAQGPGAGVYTPHPLNMPDGTPIATAAPAHPQEAQVNAGQTSTSGDAGTATGGGLTGNGTNGGSLTE